MINLSFLRFSKMPAMMHDRYEYIADVRDRFCFCSSRRNVIYYLSRAEKFALADGDLAGAYLLRER